MTKMFFPWLKPLIAGFVFLAVALTNLQAAAPSDGSGLTFFVRITEGAFGYGKKGSFILCLSDSGNAFRMISLSNLDDRVGACTYQATGTEGKVTIGDVVMTFSFLDDRRGNYALVRGGALLNGYQLGKFSAASGVQPDSLTNSVFDFNGLRVDTPAIKINYRMAIGEGNTYSIINGTVPSEENTVLTERINGSTSRLYFNDGTLGNGNNYVIFTSPTNGLFAYKIGEGKAYEKGTFTFQDAIAPEITQEPVDLKVVHGDRAEFSITAKGTQPIIYQWLKNGTPVPGATQASFAIDSVSAQDEGNYRVTVSNFLGSDKSDVAELIPVCPTSLGSDTAWIENTGGTNEVSVTSGCAWSVHQNTNSWIQILSGPGTDGDGTLTYSVSQNTSSAPRTGFLQVGTTFFKVAQQGANAPNEISGMTLRLSDISDITNFYSFYYLTTMTGTNRVFRLTQEDGTFSELFPYAYTRPSSTNGLFKVGDDEYHLEFSTNWYGSFVYTNLTSGSNFTGSFTLSESRMDWNADGYSDLLWQHKDGRLRFTSIFGTNATPVSTSETNQYIRAWGVSDMNADSLLDIVSMDNRRRLVSPIETNVIHFRNGVPVPAAWRPVTVGDLTNDKHPDFLFQNQDRKVAYWRMRGTNFTRSVSVRNGKPAGPDWMAVAVADMNMDRQQDIIFWNSRNHKAAVWYFHGGDFIDVKFLAGEQTPGDPWRLRAVADMDYDGQNDLLWQNATDGVVQIWHLDGIEKRATPESGDITIEDPVADPDWILIGPK